MLYTIDLYSAGHRSDLGCGLLIGLGAAFQLVKEASVWPGAFLGMRSMFDCDVKNGWQMHPTSTGHIMINRIHRIS